MKGSTIFGLVAVAVVGAYLGYAGWQLHANSQTCDSAYRHCPVPPDRMEPLLGAWCAPTVDAQETVRRAGQAFEVRRAVRGEVRAFTQRYVLDQGRVSFREYDAEGRPITGRILVWTEGPARRVTEIDGRTVAWARC